jgi:hypothetical protein
MYGIAPRKGPAVTFCYKIIPLLDIAIAQALDELPIKKLDI